MERKEKSEREVELAYRVARKIAHSFVTKYYSVMPPSLDFEDYVQEGMLAWLEGHDMYNKMLLAMKRNMKLSLYSYKTKKMEVPVSVGLGDVALSTDDREEIERGLDAEKMLDRLYSVKDEQTQFALVSYFYLGLSLRTIGDVLGKSHEWVRQYLILPEYKKLKEEFAC